VERVRDERHRVGDVADDDLDEEEGASQAKHGHQAALFTRVATHFDAAVAFLVNQTNFGFPSGLLPGMKAE
jgi:hypothetical protein